MSDAPPPAYETRPLEQDPTRSITYVVQKVPGQVVGRFITTETVIHTWEGPQTAHPGDFQVYGSEGETWPVAGRKFFEMYRVLGPFVGAWPRPSDNAAPQFAALTFTEDAHVFLAEKVPLEVHAFQTYAPLDLLRIADEPLHARANDWVIVYEEPLFDDTGHLIDLDAYPCEKGTFARTYHILREADEQVILPDAATIARAWSGPLQASPPSSQPAVSARPDSAPPLAPPLAPEKTPFRTLRKQRMALWHRASHPTPARPHVARITWRTHWAARAALSR